VKNSEQTKNLGRRYKTKFKQSTALQSHEGLKVKKTQKGGERDWFVGLKLLRVVGVSMLRE